MILAWAARRGIRIDFIQPGQPQHEVARPEGVPANLCLLIEMRWLIVDVAPNINMHSLSSSHATRVKQVLEVSLKMKVP